MDLEMVLNELSLHSPAPDVHIARQRMSTLLRTMRIAIQNGVNRVLRTHENFYGESLASESYGSPIFKAVQQKRCKALYRALKKSPKSPEYAVGEGSERSNVDRSVAGPSMMVRVMSRNASSRRSAVGRAVSRLGLPA